MIGSQAHYTKELRRELMLQARQIVCEEWHAAVKKYELRPGSVTEEVVAKISNRIDELSTK